MRAGSQGNLTLVVLVGTAILLLWALGGHDLWAPDEPYFAEGAREMIVDGHWAVPHVNGVVSTDKPPLFFWLIALFSLPFGEVTSFSARLPSALAGIGTVLVTMRLGRRYFDRRTAVMAGAILATNHMFWERARWAHIDSLLCLLIWVALSAFLAFRDEQADGLRAGLLFWAAAALAVLAKGPVGFLLPLGIVLLTLASDRQLGRWRSFAPVLGPLLFAAIVGSWILLAAVAGPAEYSLWGALKEHFVDRAIYGLHHKQPFWYYLEVLPVKLLPWSGLAIGAVLLAWRRRSSIDRLLLVAAFFVVIFFSISTEKRTLYILPAFPALALMMASLVDEVSGWTQQSEPPLVDRRWLTVGHGIVVGIFALVGAALPFASGRVEEISTLAATVIGAVLLGAAVTAVVCLRRQNLPCFTLAPGIATAIVYLVAVSVIYPTFEPQKSARPFAQRIREVTAESRAAGLPILSYDLGNLPEPFAFYSDGVYTAEVWSPYEVGRHLARPEQVFALVNGQRLEELAPAVRDSVYLVDQTRLSRKDVLLISNQPYPEAERLTLGAEPGPSPDEQDELATPDEPSGPSSPDSG